MGRSTNRHEPDRRRSHLARGVLSLAATAMIALPTGMAAAQQLPEAEPLPAPELPSTDGCVANPASCLPDAPEVDPCLKDPQSCLPEAPTVDPCLQDPASCLPEAPAVDECVESPESCLPEGQDVDRCVEKPQSCLSEAIAGKEPANDPDRGEEDGDEGSAAPVRGGDPPRSKQRSGSGQPVGERASVARQASEVETSLRERPASSISGDTGGGLLDRIGRGLTDAARRFAFPLAVAGLVAAFVLVQGRIDRRDPKLAAAPIHSRHDVVEFR